MKMEGKELENWTKTRQSGAFMYSLKNSGVSILLVFCIYFFANLYGYYAEGKIQEYIDGFVSQIATTIVITSTVWVVLFLLSFVFYKINDSRYNNSIK